MKLLSNNQPPPSKKQLTLACALLIIALVATLIFRPQQNATADDPGFDTSRAKNKGMRLSEVAALAGVKTGDQSDKQGGRVYPMPPLDDSSMSVSKTGAVQLTGVPSLHSRLGNKVVARTSSNDYAFLTVDSEMQDFVEQLVESASAKHVAVVMMNPKTGAILSMADKSPTIPHLALHAGFPAASLFKVITAAAAIEQGNITPETQVAFRGGTYTLDVWNYLPDPRRDRKSMTVAEALARSCNPVFGHLGLKYLDGTVLEKYAGLFGFNRNLRFDVPLPVSRAQIPAGDVYGLSRTAAGFGDVFISPIHAAAIVSSVGNAGVLPRPMLVEKVVKEDGTVVHRSSPEMLQRVMLPTTASTLMRMMEYTTTIGTSRKAFMRGSSPILGDISVAAKTGTLKGTDPIGLNNWFIGTAPIEDPKISVAVVVVDSAASSRASVLGRLAMQRFFNMNVSPEIPKQSVSYTKLRPSKKVKIKRAASKKTVVVKKSPVTTKKASKTTGKPKKSGKGKKR